MANLSLSRVNQKLSQARVLLAGVETSTPVSRDAVMEAAAFHMVCAYRHYLRELLETYSVKFLAPIEKESDVIAAFDAAKRHPAEALELTALRGDRHSWLGQLHRYYDDLWRSPVLSTHDDEQMITLVDEDAVDEVSLETLQSWQQSFVALVKRQRDTSAEF